MTHTEIRAASNCDLLGRMTTISYLIAEATRIPAPEMWNMRICVEVRLMRIEIDSRIKKDKRP